MFNIQEALKDVANEFKYLQDTSVAALEMDLLWENANPTSSFSAQTIELDLSEYTLYYSTTSGMDKVLSANTKLDAYETLIV